MRVLGILVLCFVAYLGWRFVVRGEPLVLVSPAAGKQLSASLKSATSKQLVVEVDNGSNESSITGVNLDRSLASRLGLSPPGGFKEEPLPLAESERQNKETVEFVESFNRDILRWVGALPLPSNAKTQLIIPATSTADLSGIISLQCESKAGLGGSISTLRVNLSASHAQTKPGA